MKRITGALLDQLCDEARASPRKRIHFNLHDGPEDGVQRFLNAMQPGTYVRPHRHLAAGKWELTVVLRGRLLVLLCDDHGTVTERIELACGGSLHGIELPPGAWHTSTVLEADTVLLEVKAGPYHAGSDKSFADWAPPENDPECVEYERRMRKIMPGNSLALRTTAQSPERKR